MGIVESLVSEKNQYDLFVSILLSIKSKNPTVSVENEDKGSKCKLETGRISIGQTSSEFSSYSIKIDRVEVPRLFSKNTYKYNFYIDGNKGSYSDTKLYFKSELLSSRCVNIISDIFNYLYNIEEQRKIEKTNNKIQNIISDISTTIDKSFKRDNKIDEVLNK
jgi:hypothetical protein